MPLMTFIRKSIQQKIMLRNARPGTHLIEYLGGQSFCNNCKYKAFEVALRAWRRGAKNLTLEHYRLRT